MRADERPQQRRLAGSVRPDEPEHLASPERPGEGLDERPTDVRARFADGDRRLLGYDHLIAAALRDVEAQRHGVIGGERLAQPRQSGEPLAPTLCLATVLPGDVSRDIVLLVRDRSLLLVE